MAGLRAAVDVLLEADLTVLGSPELTGLLRHLEVERRRLTAVDHRVVSEVDQRGAAGEHGRTGAADLLTTMLRVAPCEAEARVAQARATQPTRQPSGDLIAAQLPRCAAAASVGEVSAPLPADLRDDRAGIAQTSTAEIWPSRRVQTNLGDAAVVPIVIDHDGAVLRCGRTKRFATRSQRLALALRDGGCVFPGCTRPAAWCEVHHVTEWENGGRTDIDNLCLLCRYHHRSIARHGWRVEMAGGVPSWTPPAFLDPERKPVRNTVHHPHEIDFRIDVDVGRAG